MHPTPANKSVSELYPLSDSASDLEAGLSSPVLQHITAAWKALEALETDLPTEPDRWQADSLFTAREGMRRAWLAVANLDRRLQRNSRGG